MQFVVKEVSDQQTTLLDDSLRVVHQLLTAWKNAVDKIAAKSHDLTRHDPNRPDLATTLHMAEGFALVTKDFVLWSNKVKVPQSLATMVA